MDGLQFVFDEYQLNRLFPFYILIDRDFNVKSFGKSLEHFVPVQVGQPLAESFTVFTPDIFNGRFEDMSGESYGMEVAGNGLNEFPIIIEGVLEYQHSQDAMLLLGAPKINAHAGVPGRHEISQRKGEFLNVEEGDLSHEQEHMIRLPLENGRSIKGVAITDAAGAIKWVSHDFEVSVGYSLGEIHGMRPRDVIYGRESTKIPPKYVDEMVAKKRPFSFDNIGYNRSGISFWFRTTVQPVLAKNNEVTGRYYFFEDVTALKEKEQALLESRQLWKFALEGTGHGIWSVALKKNSITVSGKFKELLGYGATDIFDFQMMRQAMSAGIYNQLTIDIIPSLTAERPGFSLECQLLNRTGTYNYYSLKGKVLEWDNNYVPLIVFGTLTDISEEKRKDAELRKAVSRMSVLIERLNSAVLLENENREIILVNDSFVEIFSVPLQPAQMIGLNCGPMAEQSKNMFADPDGFLKRVDVLLTAREPVYKDVLQLADGRILERDYIPIILDGDYLGHLWRYEDVTRTKKLELSVKTSEVRLAALINNFSAGILFEDINRNILIANKAFKDIISMDVQSEGLIGGNTTEALNTIKALFKDPDGEVATINDLVEKREIQLARIVELANGRILRQQFIPIFDKEAEPGYLWIYEDISDRVTAEREIIAQREYFHRILNELPADIMIMDVDHRFRFVNKSAVRDNEMRKWLIGRNMYDYCERKNIDRSLADQREKLFQQALATAEVQRSVDTYNMPDGRQKSILRLLYPFADTAGIIQYVVGFGVDISEQVMSERKVKEQREYYHDILNEVPADVVIFSLDHKYQFINRHAIKNRELREFMIGKDDYDYCRIKNTDSAQAERRCEIFDMAVRNKTPASFVEKQEKLNSGAIFLRRIFYPCLDANGAVKFVIGYGNDVTELMQSKEQAELQAERIRRLLDIVKDGVFTCKRNGIISYYNDSFASIIGSDIALGVHATNFFDLLSEEDQVNTANCFDAVVAGAPEASCQLTIVNQGGDRKNLDFVLISSQQDSQTIFVGRVYDITESVNKEENLKQLIEKEKELNHSKSQFIRITSHELRTPLAIIHANAEILEMINDPNYPTNSKLDPVTMIGRITKEVRLMTEILNELMMVSRIEAGKVDYNPSLVHLKSFVEEIQSDLYSPYADGRNLSVERLDDSSPFFFDAKLIRHALVNLISNAFKYSRGKAAPILSVILAPDTLRFDVTDFGIGIPIADQKNLVTAFFRASNVGVINGSGLGLMVVDYAVKKHNGHFCFTSQESIGSTFSIVLPKVQTEENRINV